jgi:hypothetical protein
MRIAKRADSTNIVDKVLDDINDFRKSNPVTSPVCRAHCEFYHCGICNRYCESAPDQLSSEPDYPLERKITPLVFEIKKLGVFQPCWSCEGHNGPDGKLWKIPRVWFYAESVVYVRLLSEAVQEMFVDAKLNTPWEVVVTYSDDHNADTSFSLQPRILDRTIRLMDLQKDIITIADELQDFVALQADRLEQKVRA